MLELIIALVFYVILLRLIYEAIAGSTGWRWRRK